MRVIKFWTSRYQGGIGFCESTEGLNEILGIGGDKYDKCVNKDEDGYECYDECVPCWFQHQVKGWVDIGEIKEVDKTSLANYKDKFWWFGGDCC